MILLLHITVALVALILLPLLGCASQLQRQEPGPSVEKKAQEQQLQKQPMPTFTYRPGA
jgi:hypothetical protein